MQVLSYAWFPPTLSHSDTPEHLFFKRFVKQSPVNVYARDLDPGIETVRTHLAPLVSAPRHVRPERVQVSREERMRWLLGGSEVSSVRAELRGRGHLGEPRTAPELPTGMFLTERNSGCAFRPSGNYCKVCG